MKSRAALAVIFLWSTALPAQEFRYERQIVPGGKGPNRLALDAPLLTGAAPIAAYGRGNAGLDDLRLFDAAGREVAYLLVAPPQAAPSWSTGLILPIAATKTTSGFEADLGAAKVVDRFRIQGLPAPFLKRCRLEGSGDRSHYVVLVAEGTLFDLPDEKLVEHELPFTAGEYRYLRLTWDDRSSGRVPVPKSVEARLPESAARRESAHVALTFEKRESEPKTSRYRVRLPGPHLPLAALRLRVESGHVFREARVTEPRLDTSGNETEVKPVALGAGTLRRTEKDGAVAEDLRIPMRLPEGSEVDLVVDDGDNPPLALTGVEGDLVALPFLYFESPDGAPLVVRFGNAALKAPRYDLEAMRESASTVDAARVADARWGERKELASAVTGAPGQGTIPLGAELDRTAFRFGRPIEGLMAGLNAIRLDVAVLAHSPALSDVRVATPEGKQVPYLLERQDEPIVLALSAPKRLAPKEKERTGASRYEVALPFASLPAARLVLSTPSRLFERRVTLTAKKAGAGDDEVPTAPPSVAVWRHTPSDVPTADLSLDVPANVARLEIEVDEGDNAPLPIASTRLLLPSYRLRLYGAEKANWVLLYGAPSLGAPRYDLSLEAPRLVGLAAHEATLGPEAAPKAVPAARADMVFWGVLIAAVVVLLAL
ncbi:MAG TPA: DUF3999 family protein, partial [Thermoanaerobaculia bacterium]|nr:DUF3999 family protein [Thermoanaerobaculia bacterium]